MTSRTTTWSFFASAMPIMATLAFLTWKRIPIEWISVLTALIAIFLIYIMGWLLDKTWKADRGILSMIVLTAILATSVASAWIMTGTVVWSVLLAAVPVGIMTTANLQTGAENNRNKAAFWFKMITPYVWVGAMSMAGVLPIHTIIIFTTIAVAIACARTNQITEKCGPEVTDDIHQRTSNLNILFGLMLSLSFILATYVNFR